MKYFETIDKKEVLSSLSNTIETLKKYGNCPSELTNLYYEFSKMKTHSLFEMEESDNRDYDPFYHLT